MRCRSLCFIVALACPSCAGKTEVDVLVTLSAWSIQTKEMSVVASAIGSSAIGSELRLKNKETQIFMQVPIYGSYTLVVDARALDANNCAVATGRQTKDLKIEDAGNIVEMSVSLISSTQCVQPTLSIYADIQRDMASLSCLTIGCHDKNSTTKLKIDVAAGQEMANYNSLFTQQLITQPYSTTSPFINVPATGKATSGATHVKTLAGSKLGAWEKWVQAGALYQ